MAKRPPSSCTIGLSSGGITGTASRTIHSGLFSERMNAFTTFSRLIARCCFCPFDVAMISRSEAASASRSRSRRRSRIASAPMPPRKYTPKPYGEPNRSFISRKICSSLTTIFGSSSLKSSHVCSSRVRASSVASRASARRWSMSRYISRTFIIHATIASRSSFASLPVGPQAEVVGELAELLVVRAGLRLRHDLAEETLTELSPGLELLLVNAGNERGVLLVRAHRRRAGRRGRG